MSAMNRRCVVLALPLAIGLAACSSTTRTPASAPVASVAATTSPTTAVTATTTPTTAAPPSTAAPDDVAGVQLCTAYDQFLAGAADSKKVSDAWAAVAPGSKWASLAADVGGAMINSTTTAAGDIDPTVALTPSMVKARTECRSAETAFQSR
jgi:hypothetical protein